MSRDKLIAYLWPESEARRARNLLSQAVHALRRALGRGAIRSEGDELGLNPDAVTSDVWLFEEALGAGDPGQAVDLYSGPFLDGFFLDDAAEFERWAEGERDRLRRAYLRALEELAEEASVRGDRKAAVRWWRRLAGEEPYNAHVTVRFMEALEAAGDRAGAIREARAHTELLREELEAEPSPEVVALAERMRTEPGGAPEAAVAPTADPSRSAAAAEALEERAPVASPPPVRSRMRAGGAVAAVALLAVAGWAMVNAFGRDAPDIRRLAVLPLANYTGDPEQDYFVAGMHDALVTELGKIADLTVISRQSVLRYEGSDRPLPEIARELGVEALVEGSVFRAGDSVRVTAQLIRAAPEEHLWAGVYRGALRDALALQGEVARAIAGAVHARVTPEERARLAREHAVKPEAQEAYLRGLYHVGQHALGTARSEPPDATIRTAIALLEEAVALEPEWATAHAKLALAYHWLASGPFGVGQEFYPKSKAAALRALELDETDAQAHASLGFVLHRHERDWAGAERAIRRALELDPNAHHWIYALYLRAVERYDEAITHYRLAEERNPLSRTLKRQLVIAYYCAGRYDEAIAQTEHISALWPEGERVQIRYLRGHVYSVTGRHAEAIAELEQAVGLSDGADWALFVLAHAHARAGNHEEARRLLAHEEPERWPSPLHVTLGDVERAVAAVEADFSRRGGEAFSDLRCLPEWEILRAEPRVREILRQIGFPDWASPFLRRP